MTSSERKVIEIRRSDSRAAIVFIHGFGGSPAKTWKEFPRVLEQDPALRGWDVHTIGYTTRLIPDFLRGLWTADADIDALALLFSTTLNSPEFVQYDRLAVIAHSMGGLVAQRAVASNDGFRERIAHMFLFGTPSAGLEKAGRFFWVKAQIGDMAVDSEFIRRLRTDWSEHIGENPGFGFHVVAGERDQFVPIDSSLELFPDSVCHVIPGDHLSIVKVEDASHPGCQLVRTAILGEAFERGPLDSAALAVQEGDFQRAAAALEPAAKAGELSRNHAVDYALALSGLGRVQEAMAFLEEHPEPSTDMMGTLAGRMKRVFVHDHREPFGIRARDTYRHAYDLADRACEHPQAHYHAINIAFLSFLLADRTAADRMVDCREWAHRALEHAEQAPDDRWRHATMAEARMYLGEFDASLADYRLALRKLDEPWQVRTMYDQARIYLEETGDTDFLARLQRLLGSELTEAGTA